MSLCKHYEDKDKCPICEADFKNACLLASHLNKQLPGWGTNYLQEHQKRNRPLTADDLIAEGGFYG